MHIDGELYKCVEQFNLRLKYNSTKESTKEIINDRGPVVERMYLQNDANAFLYTLTHPADVSLILDMRKANDFGEWGREYSITDERGFIIVSFTKMNEAQRKAYTFYGAIKTDNPSYIPLKKFVRREYSYDKFRNSDNVWYPLHALELHTQKLAMGFARTKEEAIGLAHTLYTQHEEIIKNDTRFHIQIPQIQAPPHITQAFRSAHFAMEKLFTERGMYAGHPWFHQVWSRDELISLAYLLTQNDKVRIWEILEKYFNTPSLSAKLPAILPNIGNKSADGGGWLAVRFHEFITSFSRKEEFMTLLKPEVYERAVEYFERTAYFTRRYLMKKGLIFSARDETWMDTSYNDTGREGFCIEIQALTLRLYRMLADLTGNPLYSEYENELAEKVKKHFYEEGTLHDHLNPSLEPNKTIRPNIFIAYYVYPWLLTNEEWKNVFDKALRSLWLPWGGLSSIDTASPLFCNTYTGENNQSYHRGDSWYYLNCMAGYCFLQIDYAHYKEYINTIIHACVQESKTNGAIGCIAEVSSAQELTGYGCINQAWSNALFIQLCYALYGNK